MIVWLGILVALVTGGKPENQTNGTGKVVKDEELKEKCEVLTDHHGTWTGSRKPGGVYVLSCDSGFAVDGKATVNMTCSNDAEWPAKPWCEDVDDCALLLYGCGPAGLCKDLPQRAECVCERGAFRETATNGEVVCHFNKASDCGGRNCGSHGVCVHLKEYQNTFDTGNSSFRCSCERGYMDDGESCVASDCGPLEDPLGKWSGSHSYLGEYTLECAEGAFVWGGTEQAMTVSCPSYGRWHKVPRCLSPMEERRKAEKERWKLFFHVAGAATCILMAALAAGLTMGLVSLEPVEIQIIEAARLDYCTSEKERERLEMQKEAAKEILPLLKDHHLLLVTLLLLNALANEALPIFLDDLLSPIVAVLLSVTFVLLCGEILPSAVFTGPYQLTVSSRFVPVVRFLLCALYCVAKPIARILDKALKRDRFERLSRPEVCAVLRLHCCGYQEASASGFRPLRPAAEPLVAEEEPLEPVLDEEEVELCLAVLSLGDTLVADSSGFYTLKRCARKVLCVDLCSSAISVAAEAVASNKELVCVFPSLEELQWPVEVAVEEIAGILRVEDLLAAGDTQVAALCSGQVAHLEVHETVSEAAGKVGNGFGLVLRGEDFFGLFDCEEAIASAVLGSEAPSTPVARASARTAGLVVPLKSDSPSSSGSRGSPGRETVPEAARLMGQTLREVATLLTESPRLTCSVSSPLPQKDVEEPPVTRFRTDPQIDRFGFGAETFAQVPEEAEQEVEEVLQLAPEHELVNLQAVAHDPSVPPVLSSEPVEERKTRDFEEISLSSAAGEATEAERS